MSGPGRVGRGEDNNSVQPDLRLNWLVAVLLTGWLFYLLAPVLIRFAYQRYLKEHPELEPEIE